MCKFNLAQLPISESNILNQVPRQGLDYRFSLLTRPVTEGIMVVTT